jgi:hypothetical protein
MHPNAMDSILKFIKNDQKHDKQESRNVMHECYVSNEWIMIDIFIHAYVCVCVCVCVKSWNPSPPASPPNHNICQNAHY